MQFSMVWDGAPRISNAEKKIQFWHMLCSPSPQDIQGSRSMEENLHEVRHEIEQTRAALSEKIVRLENKAGEIKRTVLNPAYQVRARPLKSLGVSVLAGWTLGTLFRRTGNSKGSDDSGAIYKERQQSDQQKSGGVLTDLARQVLWGALTVALRERVNSSRLSREPRKGRADSENMDSGSANLTAAGSVEKNRGREAEQPTEIPRHGWRDIFFRVKNEMTQDNLSIV